MQYPAVMFGVAPYDPTALCVSPEPWPDMPVEKQRADAFFLAMGGCFAEVLFFDDEAKLRGLWAKHHLRLLDHPACQFVSGEDRVSAAHGWAYYAGREEKILEQLDEIEAYIRAGQIMFWQWEPELRRWLNEEVKYFPLKNVYC